MDSDICCYLLVLFQNILLFLCDILKTRKCSLFFLNEPRKFDFAKGISALLRRIQS